MSKLSDTYQKKTDIEHILDAPDTYVGAIEADQCENWSFKCDANKLTRHTYTWVPGLYKCFDEGIVNAKDHHTRMEQKISRGGKKCHPVKNIEISIDKNTGVITMFNDGNGIDVAKHPEYKVWIPELIFGHLRTSTNYNKEEKKIVGGKNGFGFKLVLIYSKWGEIETLDHTRKLHYKQKFSNNLSTIGKPKITKVKKTETPFTKISFLPDYQRFGMDALTEDMFQLFRKRTYDIAAVTNRSVKVKFNGLSLPVRSFENYVDLYIGSKSETKRLYEKDGERWEYAVCLSPLDEFTQVSFVNGICTGKGGKHIDYILNQIVKKLVAYIDKKKKIKVKPVTIKEQIMLFVNCVIENPTFDSQTKDYMNLPIKKFGSSCNISDKFIDQIAKMGIMETAISLTEIKTSKDAKKTDGRKTRSIRGLPKLIDANKAGTNKSKDCTLILCEGDSAKAGIVSGLSANDRNTIGVYPLRGKLLNIKDISLGRINQNNEIIAIKKILGLVNNKVYSSREEVTKSLRYGQVLFMTDQDLDGSHIKGLCINLFHSLWHDLFRMENFLGFMNTPILKARKGKREICFYNENQYTKWRNINNMARWHIKYYKGLGTSTAKEFREYFAKKKIVYFTYTDGPCDQSLDMAFNKKRADDRKEWLVNYDKDAVLDTDKKQVPFTDFINRELIHFSKYDCERSIPNGIDGLKPSQRKTLFAIFKRKLKKEVKVAQLSGYISEHSCYHHGEVSLQKTIVGMAQDFTGSNNINLLLPNGQFGTRMAGGKDSASERYIYTLQNPLTKLLFPDDDFPVLNYLQDDGTSIEPEFYVPIIPMILVNGAKGIGTGFSTDILPHDPIQIINYIKAKLSGKISLPKLKPYYRGFKGKIYKATEKRYIYKGIYKVLDGNRVHITELPIGVWTDDYKQYLETLIEKKNSPLRDFDDMSTDKEVDITLKLNKGVLLSLLSKNLDYHCNDFEKKFKLFVTRTTTNMHLFDVNQRMKRYESPEEIIDDYIPVRLEYYRKRKEYKINQLEKIVKILHNKARFIEEQCSDVIDLRKKTGIMVKNMLISNQYDMVDSKFDYLTSMPISSVIEENILKLRNDRDKHLEVLKKLRVTTIKSLWKKELKHFLQKYSTLDH
jgi:DNA topoisomerase-2